ncbi:sodium-translocating pyrophosphatase [Tardisphaera saccharovorans]
MEEPFPLLMGALSILISTFFTLRLIRVDAGSGKMREIAAYIKEGSDAFLVEEVKIMTVATAFLAALIFFAVGWQNAVSFLVGSLSSALAGYVGLEVSLRANVRTAAMALQGGIKPAFSTAYEGGKVMGFFVVGIALLGIGALYAAFRDPLDMVGYMFGASLMSLLLRVGGGIYTKGADIGSDLVGKVEAGIPEDDPRNPGVIADNVGDNVGDCVGMGADLFETYAVTLITAMLLGYLLKGGATFEAIPLYVAGASVIATLVGSLFVVPSGSRIMNAFYRGLAASAVLGLVIDYFLVGQSRGLYLAIVIGTLVLIAMYAFAEYFTSYEFRPVRRVAERSQTGAALNIITGMANGLKSTVFPVIVVAAAVLAVFILNGGLTSSLGDGIYAIAISAVAMMSFVGMVISIDTFGPITDNAGGIAEMAGLPSSVRESVTDVLDSVGNTTKATTKAYAIASAALASLSLFAGFELELPKTMLSQLLVYDPLVLVGMFIGGVVPFVFTALLMDGVGVAAFGIVNEIRRQFKVRGIAEGEVKPDYAACVDITTRVALRELALPAMIAAGTPIMVGLVLGPLGLSGYMFGAIVTGFPLAIWMTTGGGAWDNAKKYVESGVYGGKNSEAHKAAVIGDTVGDATKDTAGPAVNPFIKVMVTVSVLFAPIIVFVHLL